MSGSRLLNIGFGNLINADKIMAIVSYDSAPAKRLVANAKRDESVIDATQGRKTKSLICLEDKMIVLSALTTDTLLIRSQEKSEK